LEDKPRRAGAPLEADAVLKRAEIRVLCLPLAVREPHLGLGSASQARGEDPPNLAHGR
jgi:hypothetical protein